MQGGIIGVSYGMQGGIMGVGVSDGMQDGIMGYQIICKIWGLRYPKKVNDGVLVYGISWYMVHM